MSLSNQTQFALLAGNGAAAQVFPFAFRCTAAANLSVEFRQTGGAVIALSLNTDYTVFLNANQESNPGGTVTLTDAVQAAPTAATVVAVLAAAPNTQPLDLPTGGAFSAAAIEAQLDSLTQQIQVLRDRLSAAPRGRLGDSMSELPNVTQRAGKALTFDALGNPVATALATLGANGLPLTGGTMSGAILGTPGAAALPGYAFSGDADTGVFSPGAGALAVTIDGSERIRFAAAGLGAVLATSTFAGPASFDFLNANAASTTAEAVFRARNSARSAIFGITGTANTMAEFTGGPTAEAVVFGTAGNIPVSFGTNGIERLRLFADGRVAFKNIHNNGTVTGTTDQFLASGTYTPTLGAVVNIGAATAPNLLQWIRLGNIVVVSGVIEVDPSAAAANTAVNLTLPIPTTLPSFSTCTGTAVRAAGGVAQLSGFINGDIVLNRAQLQFYNDADVANRAWYLVFVYLIA